MVFRLTLKFLGSARLLQEIGIVYNGFTHSTVLWLVFCA